MKFRWKKIPWQRWGIDRKRGLMALGLVAVAMLLWGRLILKNAPRTALADPKEALAAAQLLQPRQAARLTREIPLSLPATAGRDLFAIAEGRYQRREISSDSSSHAKLTVETVDSDERTLAVRQAAAAMRLQTTILGQPPRAVIDGQLVSQGETVKGFVILEIEQRQVILQKDGIQIRLEM